MRAARAASIALAGLALFLAHARANAPAVPLRQALRRLMPQRLGIEPG